MRSGVAITVPELEGRWTVWSKADDCPGAHFVVPADDKARATGIKYAVVRVLEPAGTVTPIVQLRRTDPANLMPAQETR